MNTYHAKQIDDSGEVVALHSFSSEVFPTDPLFVEITEEEYNTLLEGMTPPAPLPTDQISDSEALNIILGGVSDDER